MGAEADDPRTAERVGALLADKWTLEKLIGTGGMGAVYEARHRNGARAALKILHPDLARVPEVRERFLREGYAANRVEHRGAVKVLDDDFVKEGPDAGSAYLVMELLDGESLEARSLRPPLVKEMEMLEIMDAVLDVLDAAHSHGVVHRDLKPENLFLAQDEDATTGVRVKVLDFGLARINEVAGKTSAGLALGTPSFMSPEQAAGKADEIDGQTDIFALGATAYRVITGRRIHDAENVVHLVVKMATMPATPIREIMPELSEAFAGVVDKALAFEKKDRYPTASAMRDDVRAALLALRGDADTVHVAPYSKRKSPTLPAIDERVTAPAPSSDPPVPPVRAPAASVKPAEPSRSIPWEPKTPSRLPFLLLFAAVLSVVAFKFGDDLQTKLEQLAQPFQAPKPTASAPPPASAEVPSVTSMELDDAGPDDDDDDAGDDDDASATALVGELLDDLEGDAGKAAPSVASSATSAASAAAQAHKPAPPAPHPPQTHKPPPAPKRPPPHPPHRPKRR